MKCQHCNREVTSQFRVATVGPAYNNEIRQIDMKMQFDFCDWNCVFLFLIDGLLINVNNGIVDEEWKPVLKNLHDHIQKNVSMMGLTEID